MARLQYTRREVNRDDVLQQVIKGDKKLKDAANELGISVEEVMDAIKKMHSGRKDTRGYHGRVQKMISFRGTVRAMTVMANNRKGGKYPLRIINLYMKPGTERYYEENLVNPVDKHKIRTGSESEGYHAKAARWSGTTEPTQTGVETPIPDGTIVIERKKGKSFVSIVLRRNPVYRKNKRKSINRRK